MYNDIVDLRSFYDSGLGQVARRLIRRQLRALWPDTRGMTVLGLGYATPYLRPFRDDAERVVSLMPAGQGVTRWPRYTPSLVGLTYDNQFPLPDVSVDRVVIVHGVEVTEHLAELLQEVWRILVGNGRIILVVPSRSGLWARTDRTPFGHGRPYSVGQVQRMLQEHQFVPERVERALFVPPIRSGMVQSWAPALEQLGRRWTPAVGGVMAVEASKQLYHVAPTARPIRLRRPLLLPVPKPAMGRSARSRPFEEE